MKITYDKEANAAYILIKENILPGEVKKTYCCNVNDVNGFINLDFDKNGKLIGVEVLDAKSKLPEEALKYGVKQE
ncbi:MAG: hypothetical protein K0R98_1872 [Rickettsiaceae bacterium]|jgi:uncharacterized protein YuzE|nr:hypothetical protein [Rickettsiaceae bacterium]